jgi:WD40 repeat protein
MAFSPDGQVLACGNYNRTIRLWDLRTGACVILPGHAAWVQTVAFSPDGLSLASGGDDNTVYLWNVRTGQLLACFPCLDDVLALWFHPTQPLLQVADRGAGTGAPNIYQLEIVRP